MDHVPYFDLNLICRICLKGEAAVSIYSEAFTVRPIDMIQKMDLFRIDNLYGLSTWLCQTCITRLIDAYNLKEQCEYSNARLNEYFHMYKGYNYNTNRTDTDQGYMKTATGSDVSSSFAKDDEIYDAVNIACEILNENHSRLSTADDDVLNDVIIDVNSLTQSEDSAGFSVREQVTNGIGDADQRRNCDQINCMEYQIEDANGNGIETESIEKNTCPESKETKSNKKNPAICSVCGKSFDNRTYLETHMRIHTGEKPFQCKFCQKRFTQSNNLTLHLRTHTGEKRFQCDICSQLFTTSSNLKTHIATHSEERKFQCSECLRSFKTAKDLNSHSATHSNIKLFSCKVCSKEFLKMSYLNDHMRKVHQGERKHKCTQCDKVFSNSSNLICHMRTHTGERPYKCTICNVSFNQSSALMRHTKRHSKQKSSITTTKIVPQQNPENKCVQSTSCQKFDIENILMSDTPMNNGMISPLIPPIMNTSQSDIPLHNKGNQLTALDSASQALSVVNDYVIDFSRDSNLDFSRSQHSFVFHN